MNTQAATAVSPVVENQKWLIAREFNTEKDSRMFLENLGFTVIVQNNNLFYEVEPPKGWQRIQDGCWTTYYDADGKKRFSQLYKPKIHSSEAYLTDV